MERCVSSCCEKFDTLGPFVIGLLFIPCCSSISGLMKILSLIKKKKKKKEEEEELLDYSTFIVSQWRRIVRKR